MVDDAGIVIFLDERQCGFPSLRHAQYEIDPDRLLGSQSEGAPERDDRIENGTYRTGKRRRFLHGRRADRCATSPDKSCAVRFAGDFIPGAFFSHHRMQEPRSHFAFGARAPGAQNS